MGMRDGTMEPSAAWRRYKREFFGFQQDMGMSVRMRP
jgi:hypothetical protein